MFEWLFWEQYSHEPQIAVRIARKHYLGKREDELDPSLLTKGNAALARMELQLTRDAVSGRRRALARGHRAGCLHAQSRSRRLQS